MKAVPGTVPEAESAVTYVRPPFDDPAKRSKVTLPPACEPIASLSAERLKPKRCTLPALCVGLPPGSAIALGEAAARPGVP